MDGGRYEPEAYWDAKARAAGGDRLRAVALDCPLRNRVMDRVQRQGVAAALEVLAHRGATPTSVLDFGCGVGRWRELFESLGARWAGCDLSGEMVKRAEESAPGRQVRKLETGGRLPWEAQCFDLALSIAVLHHNPAREQARWLRELARVVRPGGHVLLLESVRAEGGEAVARGIEQPRSIGEWRDLAAAAGLTLLWHRGAKYALAASVAQRFPGALGAAGARLGAWADAWLAPWLGPKLPERMQDRAAMLLLRDDPARTALSEHGTSLRYQ
ncbi:MAG: class I SAM-dependent methyltransferase [Planctomycetes bacterium]|nr:class I SAM-dependent methyltransferase [Planctomycetota bacterium]